MGEVIELRGRRKAAPNSETKTVLSGMLDKEENGALEGAICISATDDGTEIHVLGSFADRLQVGVIGLVKALDFVCNKIGAKGRAGNTPGGTTNTTNPRRRLPKRLKEATNFGELE